MTFTQSAGLRDRKYASHEAIQAGSRTGVITTGNYNRIKTYTFTPTDLTSSLGSLTTYSNYAINGEIKRISVDTGNWTATGSLWIRQSGTSLQPAILMLKSGTTAYGSKQPIYPGEYASYTASGTGTNTAVQVGSPNMMFPLICTEKVIIEGSGLGTGKSGLGIIIDYM